MEEYLIIKKILRNKIENMFNEEIRHVFQNTKIYCLDFADFFKQVQVTENDFIFLDPPYDTDFSDYENRQFTKDDQIRLANELKKIKAKFILVIKNTDFIRNLYENNFNIISFDNTYTYNVRGRNTRDVEHLIITNIID
jgi:DNA adenine methylase